MDPLAKAAEVVRRALDASQVEPVHVRASLPRETAELLLVLIEAQRRGGATVLPTRREVSPAQAAALLGVSRPHVYQLLDEGRLEHRRVGTHRRIPVDALASFRAEEKTRRREAMTHLAAVSDQFGVTD